MTVRETVGERRKAEQRFTEEDEARDALARVYADHKDRGTWEVKQYG